MRRASLLVILLAASPPVAVAQNAGQVVVNAADGDDQFINIDECNGVGPTGPLSLSWNVQLESGTVAGGAFFIFASNKAPVTSGSAQICPPDNDADGTHTAQIGAEVPPTGAQTTGVADRSTADFGTAAEFDCAEGQGDRTIHVCVEYRPTTGSSSRTGWAVGQLTLALRRPAAPTGVGATGGEGALNIAWSEGTQGPNDAATASYRVQVTPQGGSDTRTVEVNDTDARVEGLTNDVIYDIAVFALSDAENVSSTAATGTGTPKPVNDFWDTYEAAGGREEGGCASGGAGTFALAGVASLLGIFLRRRK
jgi:MYXO-CTERM domain-containing protein